MSKQTRVAAAQFHIGNDVQANLDTCVRMIAAAAEHAPELLVLPEFCNHCSWYDGPEHCFEVSVDIDGAFMQRIAAATAWSALLGPAVEGLKNRIVAATGE